MSTARNPMSIDPRPALAPTDGSARSTSRLAIAALIVGIASLVLLTFPPAGFAAALVGLALGIVAWRQGRNRTMAMFGIVLSGVTLALILAVIFLVGAVIATA